MKKIVKILSCGLVALTLTGCGKSDTPSNGNSNVITFNDSSLNVTVDELYKELKERYGANYLIQSMDEKLLNKEYETDDDANNYAENQLKIYRLYYGNNENDLLNAIRNSGYNSLDEFKEMLIANYKKTLLTDDYVKNNIDDSDINKYYENNIYGDITISHILIRVNKTDTMTDDEKKEEEKKAQDKITEIYKKLGEGKEFAEVAKESSEDYATTNDGGLLGTFNKDEMTEKYNKEFEEAAKNLKVGKYTDKVVESSYGYHIIYKNEEKEKPKLETVKQMIIDKLVDDEKEKDTKLEYKAMIDLREKYGLKFNDDDVKSQYDNAVNNWLYSKD